MKHEPLKTYLRTHRRRLGLSQDEVAYLLGSTSGTSVSRHERAGRLPKLDTALAYEIILGVPVRNIYAGEARLLEEAVQRRVIRLVARISRRPATAQRDHKLRSLARLSARAA